MDRFAETQSRWFSPLQMLELDACTRCQECVRACPVVTAGYPGGAMERIAGWRMLGTPPGRLLSRLARAPAGGPDRVALFSSLFRCTSCGACSIVCESGIACAPLCESMMGAGREMGFVDPGVEKVAGMVMRGRNQFVPGNAARGDWIPEGTRIADAAPIGLFAGCMAAFRQPELGRAALRILERSGTRFCMLQEKESCCGSILFRSGSWPGYRATLVAMIEDLEARGVKTLLVLCAGCLKTILLDWPRVIDRELPFQPVPFAVFLRDLVREGKIRFGGTEGLRVAYHDPCYGGRHLMHPLGRDRVFEAPREVLAAIPGLELVEFDRNREHQVCCGAGGGVKAGEPALALRIAREKIAAVDGMRAQIVASTCPFCRRNLDDAREACGSPVEVLDLVQLADRMMLE